MAPPPLQNKLQGRAPNEVPLGQVFGTNFNNAIGVTVQDGFMYRNSIGCGVAGSVPCSFRLSLYTSVDQHQGQDFTALCGNKVATPLFSDGQVG
jgi:hypothetical protein